MVGRVDDDDKLVSVGGRQRMLLTKQTLVARARSIPHGSNIALDHFHGRFHQLQTTNYTNTQDTPQIPSTSCW